MFIDIPVVVALVVVFGISSIYLMIQFIHVQKLLKQSRIEFQDYFTETSGTIVLKQNEIDALKKKAPSQEILDVLKDLNEQGALLSITRVNQDNIYFHTGR